MIFWAPPDILGYIFKIDSSMIFRAAHRHTFRLHNSYIDNSIIFLSTHRHFGMCILVWEIEAIWVVRDYFQVYFYYYLNGNYLCLYIKGRKVVDITYGISSVVSRLMLLLFPDYPVVTCYYVLSVRLSSCYLFSILFMCAQSTYDAFWVPRGLVFILYFCIFFYADPSSSHVVNNSCNWSR